MVYMIEKKYANEDLEIELTSDIDYKQNVWFKGKDIATILNYKNTRKAIYDHVDSDDKQLICWCSVLGTATKDPRGKWYTFINESGFYSLVIVFKNLSRQKIQTLGNSYCVAIYQKIWHVQAI